MIWGFLLALGPALVAAVVTVVWQASEQRKLAKQNNSINAMAVLQRDNDLSRAMNVVAKTNAGFRPNGQKDSVVFYASSSALMDGTGEAEWDEDSREKSRALFVVVDYFEAVSVGILRNIYDKEIIRDIACSTFVEVYQRTEPFIRKVREEEARKNAEDGVKTHEDRGPESFGKKFGIVAKEFSEWRHGR